MGEYGSKARENITNEERKLIINTIYKAIESKHNMRRCDMKDQAIKLERSIK